MSNRIYSDEMIDYVKELFETLPYREAFNKFQERYPGIDEAKFKYIKESRHIKTKVLREKRVSYIFTEEQDAYLREIVKGRTGNQIAKMMNDKFNTSFKKEQIINRKKTLGLRCGKYKSEPNSGQFKKGTRPPNYKDVGSLKFNEDGEIVIKKTNKLEHTTKNYKYLRREIYGLWHPDEKLTENDYIVFLDDNKYNFAKDNMMKISRSENGKINSYMQNCNDKSKINNSDLKKSLILSQRLENAIKEKE